MRGFIILHGEYLVLFLSLLVVITVALIVISIGTETAMTVEQCETKGGEFCVALECPDEKIGEVRDGTNVGVCCKGGCG